MVCPYPVPPDRHFIIDRHPKYPQVAIAPASLDTDSNLRRVIGHHGRSGGARDDSPGIGRFQLAAISPLAVQPDRLREGPTGLVPN